MVSLSSPIHCCSTAFCEMDSYAPRTTSLVESKCLGSKAVVGMHPKHLCFLQLFSVYQTVTVGNNHKNIYEVNLAEPPPMTDGTSKRDKCCIHVSYICSSHSPDSSPVWKRRKQNDPDSPMSDGKNPYRHQENSLERYKVQPTYWHSLLKCSTVCLFLYFDWASIKHIPNDCNFI